MNRDATDHRDEAVAALARYENGKGNGEAVAAVVHALLAIEKAINDTRVRALETEAA